MIITRCKKRQREASGLVQPTNGFGFKRAKNWEHWYVYILLFVSTLKQGEGERARKRERGEGEGRQKRGEGIFKG